MPASAIPYCSLLPVLLLFYCTNLAALSLAAEDTYSRLAQAQDAGDHDAVREICLRMLQKKQSDTRLLRILAKIQLQSAETEACDDTLALLEAALGKPDAGLLEMRGDLASLGKGKESKADAARHWKAALILQPGRISVVNKLADYYRSVSRPAEEAIYLEQLASLRGQPDELVRLARHAVRLRDWDTIISCTAQLQEKFANREAAKLWNPIYDRLMRHSVALKIIDNRLETGGQSAEILLERAWLFDKTGLNGLALNDAEKAFELRPGSFTVKYQLAVILAHAGKTLEAATRLKIEVSAYARRPLHPPASFFSGLTEIESRLANKPDAGTHVERANMLLEVRQEELALDDAAAAVAMDPGFAGAHLILARVFESRGKTLAAKSAYKRILQLDGNHLVALEEFGRLHIKLGDYETAIVLLKRRLDLLPDKYLQRAYDQCFASLQISKP
jgi:tetratricopeptide (TPR) repeat protein